MKHANKIVEVRMILKRTLPLIALTGVTAWGGLGNRAQAQTALVALDAANLQDGPLASWDNTGSLKGAFKSDE